MPLRRRATDEVDEIRAQAGAGRTGTAGDALYQWPQLFFDFAHNRNDVATELIPETGLETAVFREDRRKICTAGQPLLQAAQESDECGVTLDIGRILDALVYIGRIQRNVEHVQPIVDTFLRGPRPDRSAGGRDKADRRRLNTASTRWARSRGLHVMRR